MDLHDKIAEFLRSQKGGRFCDECILKEVGADLGDVPNTLGRSLRLGALAEE